MAEKTIKARRIVELDLLRGFLIIVIILDHLQFWPSPWQYLTGQGRLWTTAAEIFFIISGFLIGYLRAYKEQLGSLKDMSIKLWKRAGLLWLWCVIITIVAIALALLLPGNNLLIPTLPTATILNSPTQFLWNVFTMRYAYGWIDFLRLYALMLAVTPLFLWLIRKKQTLIVIALLLGSYLAGLLVLNEAFFEWQTLFFGAALTGWKLESILGWLRQRPKVRRLVVYGLIIVTSTTMVISYLMAHSWSYVEAPGGWMSRDTYIALKTWIDPYFTNYPLMPARVILSFIWFFGLLSAIHLARKPLRHWLGWLLLTFGTASLTAYCLQAILLTLVVKFVLLDGSFIVNGIVSLAVLLLIWLLMKIPVVRKIFPQ